ncbi:MAG: lysylphosphatidylglycerol synthase transmembrane domain-containing protein [Candidatus Thermoplasmatota archaeon]|nr:lysylphosphatidylglycerol synthase transmembrane domain-containing protein [Candidatus Thermoplasmatota archaeon]
MSKKIYKFIKKFLPLIGIIVLIIIIINLDLEKIKTAFLSINPIFVILSMSLLLPIMIIKNYVWQIILKEQKIKLTFYQSLKIYMIGFFYSSITPGFLGHLMRIPYIKEKTNEPYGKLFVNIFIDTTIRTIAQYLMIFIGTLIIFTSFPQIFTIFIVFFTIIGLILYYFIKRERGEKFFYNFVKYFIPKKLKKSSYKFVKTFYHDFPKISLLIIPLILGILVWTLIFTQEYIIVYAMGVDIPYLYFLVLFPIANIAGYLPITIAGLGMREFTSILIFSTLFGIAKEEVLVFTLLGFVITDIFPGFIGFLFCLSESDEKIIKKSFFKN